MANMAVHWNNHLMNIFDGILGEYLEEWYTLYVDDLGVHGVTPEQAKVHGKILESILTVMEKPFSDNTTGTGTNSVQTSLDIAGMH